MSAVELSEMLALRLQQGYLSSEDHKEVIKLRAFVVIRQWLRDYYNIDFDNVEVSETISKAIEQIRKACNQLTLADHQILLHLSKHLPYQSGDDEKSVDSTSMCEGASEFSARERTLDRLLSMRISPDTKSTSVSKLSRRLKSLLIFPKSDATVIASTTRDSINLMLGGTSPPAIEAPLTSATLLKMVGLTFAGESGISLESSSDICQ